MLTAGDARQLAEQALARRWLAGDKLKLRLPPGRLGLLPGAAIQLAGSARPWVVRNVSIEGMAVAIEAESAAEAIRPLPSDPGRPVSEPDVAVGRSQLALIELPARADAPADSPVLFVAASNEGLWKRLPVELRLSEQPLPAVEIARRSVLGQAETALEPGSAMISDERSHLVVRLSNTGQVLLNANGEALLSGSNLALVGDELIQFGRAQQLGPGRFRLSGLLRGRRGTEWAAGTHAIGDLFCLIEPYRLQSIFLPAGSAGAGLEAVAMGVGDHSPFPHARRLVAAEAMRPPGPCHLEATRSGGGIFARWIRRSHRHWAWTDGIGDGSDAFPELYRVTATGPGGQTIVETADRSLLFAPEQIPGVAGQSITLSVATAGPTAWSRPVQTSLIL